jgi:hypothetical protein
VSGKQNGYGDDDWIGFHTSCKSGLVMTAYFIIVFSFAQHSVVMLQKLRWAPKPKRPQIENVCLDLCLVRIPVAQQLLDGGFELASLAEVRGIAGQRGGTTRYAGSCGSLPLCMAPASATARFTGF